MDVTTFLAQLWGIVMVCVGVGMLADRSHYGRIYHSLGKEPMGTLAFGILAMIVGFLQVSLHSVWGNVSEIVVSLLGWGTFLKGTVMIVMPSVASKNAEQVASAHVFPAIGIAVLALGAYLCFIGFFA